MHALTADAGQLSDLNLRSGTIAQWADALSGVHFAASRGSGVPLAKSQTLSLEIPVDMATSRANLEAETFRNHSTLLQSAVILVTGGRLAVCPTSPLSFIIYPQPHKSKGGIISYPHHSFTTFAIKMMMICLLLDHRDGEKLPCTHNKCT